MPNLEDNRIWLSDQDWKEGEGYYKYMWWGINRPNGDYIYLARGHLGQVIAVSPKEKIVIVRFGIDGEEEMEEVFLKIIEQN